MKLWDFIRPYKYHAFFGFLFKIIEAILELMIPLIIALIIDKGIVQGDSTLIMNYGLLLIGCSTTGYICALICQYFASYTSQSVGTKIRTELFHKINTLSLYQVDTIQRSSLVTRITGDIIQIQQAIAMTIRLTSRAPFLIVGSLILSFLLSPQLTSIFIVGAIILIISMTFITVYSLKQYTVIQKIVDRLYHLVKETIEGNRVIRAFSKQTYQKEGFDQVLKDHCNKQIHVGMIQDLSNPLTYFIVNVCILCIVYQGGLQVQIGNLTQGEVIALVNYMTQILLALIVYTNVMTLYNRAGVCHKRVMEVLHLEDEIEEGVLDVVENNEVLLSFNNVDFGYTNKDILSAISFDVNKGESIGIIGSTGCGKSTLVKLIQRFYDYKRGAIYLYGKELKEYSKQSLHDFIGYVPQINALFSGTIRSNLLMKNKDASNEMMVDCLTKAQAKDMIDGFKDGIDTVVEQGGMNFSGGQRQRICIARALMNNPKLLILDDSSSALDNVTERNLKLVLNGLDCTKIIISQRVSTIKDLDKIIVMEQGRIESIGSHDVLMKQCKIYQEIYSSQNKEVK